MNEPVLPTDDWPVEIIRSPRRKKSVSGRLVDGTLVIRAPAKISDRELQPHIEALRGKVARRIARDSAPYTDSDLDRIANEINQTYFDAELSWEGLRFVTNQNSRFGSCSPRSRTIRISHRVAYMPLWVIRYVLIHELAHLLEANHGPGFWALVNRYPKTERARGYLMAAGLDGDE